MLQPFGLLVLLVLLPQTLSALMDSDLQLEGEASSNQSFNYMQSSDPFLGVDITPKVSFEVKYGNRKEARDTDAFLAFLAAPNSGEARVLLRNVSVTGYGSIANWTLVLSALSKVPNLARIDWHSNAPIPLVLLQGLEETHPDLQLFYTLPFDNRDPWDPDVSPIQFVGEEHAHNTRVVERESVLSSKILCSVKGNIRYGENHNPYDMALVHGILTSCPKVKNLDLSVQWAGGCRVGAEQPHAFDFSSSSPFFGKEIASLESIKLDGYCLDNMLNGYRPGGEKTNYTVTWPVSLLPRFVLRHIGYHNLVRWGAAHIFVEANKDQPSNNIDGWLHHMDWSHIRTLEVDSASAETVGKLQPVLKDLSSLTVHYAGCGSAAAWHELLRSRVNSLTSLSFKNVQRENFDDTISTLVAHHGSTLTSLGLGEWEGFREYSEWINETYTTLAKPHVYLTTTHLETLAEGCPKLEHLDIDINRMSSTMLDNNALDVLPSFSKLASLIVRLESPDTQYRRTHSEQRYSDWLMHTVGPDRIINATSVHTLFQNLRSQQQKRQQIDLPLLASLEVVVGKWSGRRANGMSSPSRHLIGHWQCTVGTCGKEICEGRNILPDYWSHVVGEYEFEIGEED